MATPENPPTLFDPATCVKKGLCPVTSIRKQGSPAESHSLYYEVHGTGSDKIVFIMGLNTSSFAWLEDVKYFSKTHTCLVFDNRGVGNSDSPKGPYTTSGMAEDVIVLLDYVGWTAERELHVVGVSLGGMIAQELALRIPQRIASLSLIVTRAGGYSLRSLVPWKGLSSLTRITLSTDDEHKVALVLDMLYPQSWLKATSRKDPNRTNWQVAREGFLKRIEVQRKQTLAGSVAQMAAATTHHVTPAQLQTISKSIPKILILTGDEDHLIDPSNSIYLKEHMPEAQYELWRGAGHACIAQYPEEFHRLLEQVMDEAKSNIAKGTTT